MTIICPVTVFIITTYFRQVVSIGTFYYADKQRQTARWNVLSGWFLTSLQPPVDFCPRKWFFSPLSCRDQLRAVILFQSTHSREVTPQQLLENWAQIQASSLASGPCCLRECCCSLQPFTLQQLQWCCPLELLLFLRPGVGICHGVARRRGYIWLFIEKWLGIHTYCFLHDAAWHLSGSHIVLTHTWYCLTSIGAFLKCLSISPLAASHLFTGFAPQAPCSILQKVCVHLCCGGDTWTRFRHLGAASSWWWWQYSNTYVSSSIQIGLAMFSKCALYIQVYSVLSGKNSSHFPSSALLLNKEMNVKNYIQLIYRSIFFTPANSRH